MGSFDLSRVDLTAEDAEKLLARPGSYMRWERNEEMFKTWALGPVLKHRDSGLLEQSNAAAFERELTRAEAAGEIEPESWRIECANHWAVGHVDQIAYRVIDAEGEPTNVARLVRAWFDHLREVYPVADSEDYSEREYEATLSNIEDAARWCRDPRLEDFVLPEGWAEEAYRWFSENQPSAIENRDDQGGSPSSEEIAACCEALGWIPATTDPLDGEEEEDA